MIFLNADRYIEEAIQSIRAQTHDHWELILVDDGSTDGSTAIARRHAFADSAKVRYLEHEGHRNLGMSASRNLGIRHARGTYLTFLDADDIWLPRKLERQLALLRSCPEAAMVCNPTLWWYSWTGNPDDAHRDAVRELGVPGGVLYGPRQLLAKLLRRQARTPATCSVLVRREAIEAVGGFEDDFRGMYEDQVFFAKMYLAYSTYVTDELLDRYRQHPASTCGLAANAGYEDPAGYHRSHLEFLEWLAKYLAEAGDQWPEIEDALRWALWPYRHPWLDRIRSLPGAVARDGGIGVMRRLARPIARRLRGGVRRLTAHSRRNAR